MWRKRMIGLLLSLLIIPVIAIAGTVQLPQTGQTSCWDESGNAISCTGTGQDGDKQMGVSWPEPRFTDNGDQTMTDNLTGLIWTKDANAPGPAACSPGTTKTWQEALDYVACLNSNNYLNHSDWRLPNRKELKSLVQRQLSVSSWLIGRGFVNVRAVAYWSSTTHSGYLDSAWVVHMSDGYVESYFKSGFDLYKSLVWPVRGGQPGTVQLPKTGQVTSYAAGDDGALQKGVDWPNPRFTDNGNGTVTDNLTGLIWLANANCTNTAGGISKANGYLNWANALTWSNNLASGACGLTDGSAAGDWRLPNIEEQESLIDLAKYLPALPTVHPFRNVHDKYWSSSSTRPCYEDSAWIVNQTFGYVEFKNKTDNYYVWPVRSGQSGSSSTILTVTKFGNGSGTVTSSPAGINCGSQCTAAFVQGTSVTLTAQAGDGSTFSGWSGAECSGTGACTVTMDAAKSVTALFGGTIGTDTSVVPDTGQTKCYNNTSEITCPSSGETFYGQDAQYSINPHSYMKLDASGNTLPDSATSWVMVKDNVTGLTWENKTTDGSIHDAGKTFTWCNTNQGYTKGCGTGIGNEATDTEAYIKALNDASFGGFSDWRLPTPQELTAIVDRDRYNPAIDAAWFPNTVSSFYWTSVAYQNQAMYAWCVVFSDGELYGGTIGDDYSHYNPASYAVRAVRGGQGEVAYVDNGDGTVTDTKTGLMWQQATVSGKDWQTALDYAENLTLAGYSDWRLPNASELFSLVDHTRHPAIDPIFTGALPSQYWSSSTYAVSPGSAWHINFEGYSSLLSYTNKTAAYAVRAVRGGQSGSFGYLILSPSSGIAPLTVGFSVTSSVLVSQYRWDFDGDGIIDDTSFSNHISHTFITPGSYAVKVTVLDYDGKLTTLTPVMVVVTASGELTGSVTFVSHYPESDSVASNVMQGGKAIRYYRVVDDSGNPLPQKAVHYRYAGTIQQIDTSTDDQGFVKIETDWLTSSQQVTIEVLDSDGSLKSNIALMPSFYVNITERELEQEWTGMIGVKGNIGVGGPEARLGPLKFSTIGAGLEGGLSTKTTLNYQIKGSDATVIVTNGIGVDVDGSLKAGLFGQAWNVKKRPEIEVGFTVGGKGNVNNGSTLELQGFLDTGRPDHSQQALALGIFLLETSASNYIKVKGQLPVGFNTIYEAALNRLTEQNAYSKTITSEMGFGLYGSGGASIKLTNPLGIAAGSGLTMSFLNFNAEAVFTRKTDENTDGTQLTTLGFTREINVSPFKLSLSQKFGGDKRRKDTPEATFHNLFSIGESIEANESIALEKDSYGRVSSLSFTKGISSSGNTYGFFTESTERSLKLSIGDTGTITSLRYMDDASIINDMMQGNALILTGDSFAKAYSAAISSSNTLQSWGVERADIVTFSMPLEIGLGLGLQLGLGIDIEGTYSLKFAEQKGVVSSLKGMMQTEQYHKDSYITGNTKELHDFYDACTAALTDAILSTVETVSNRIENTVNAAGSVLKETVSGAWANCTGFISKIVTGQKFQVILARAYTMEGILSEYAATAIGDVYIVNMKDADGNLITDYSASPLELTIEYTDSMLADAGLSEKASKLAIYLWDGSSGFYIHQASVVDQINKKVTAAIIKPGQYVLAIDDTPPVISSFQVSNHTSTPSVSAIIRDTFSGIDPATLTFSLDGNILVNSGNWSDYYDIKSGFFNYVVATSLAEGSHTAEITVNDTAGNAAALAQLFFDVNTTPPAISHPPVPNAQIGTDLPICATIADDTGIQRVVLFYRPENGNYDYQSIEMTLGVSNTYCASIPGRYITTLGIRYYIHAEDISGNSTTIKEPVVISTSGTDVIPKITGLKAAWQGNDVLLTWDKSSALATAGYRVYYGQTSDDLRTINDNGDFISILFSQLDKTKMHYFAVVGYDESRTEGTKSDTLFFPATALYATYPDAGIWKNDGSEWSQITTGAPVLMVTSGTDLYATFTGGGIWKYNGADWSQATSNNPDKMVVSGTTLYGTFTGNGIWKFDGTNWSQVTSNNPDDMVIAGGSLYGTFGTSGVWKYDGSDWSQATTNTPTQMVGTTNAFYGIFEGSGIWKYEGTEWTQVTSNTPEQIISGGTNLYGTFAGSGIWKYNGTDWSNVTPNNPQQMTATSTALYGVFSGTGIWKHDGTSWSQVTANDPLKMVAGE